MKRTFAVISAAMIGAFAFIGGGALKIKRLRENQMQTTSL